MNKKTTYGILLCIAIYTQGIWCNNYPFYGNRIVGGINTDIIQYPYNAFCKVQTNDGMVRTCGGAIISKNSILTAAYCLDDAKIAKVRIGSTYRHSGGYEYNSTTFSQHPRYHRGGYDYDVGIITIDEEMNINGDTTDTIQVENMQKDTEVGEFVTITGWGANNEYGIQSEVLRMAKIEVQNKTNCEGINSTFKTTFCAGGNGVNSCKGDIGGPAVGLSYTLVGVTSNRVGCSRNGQPGIYARVASIQNRIFIRAMARV